MNTTYSLTNPWIRFELGPAALGRHIWMILGKIQARCECISQIPILPRTAHEYACRYAVKGVHGSAAMGGNSPSEEDVRRHVEKKIGDIPRSQASLHRAVQNIIDACDETVLSTAVGQDMTPARIRSLNAALLAGTQYATHVTPGEMRVAQIRTGTYAAPPVADCPRLLEQLCQWLNGDTFNPPEKHRTFALAHALLKAVSAHIYLVWIHPFDDGNGRTARLVEFQILVSAGVPAPSAHLLSNHYFTTRREYDLQIESATRIMSLAPFIEYAVQGFLDGLDEQLGFINERNGAIAWQNHIDDSLRGERTAVRRRLIALAQAVSTLTTPIPPLRLFTALPQLLLEYAGVTSRTLYRDLKELQHRGLIAMNNEGVLASRHGTQKAGTGLLQ